MDLLSTNVKNSCLRNASLLIHSACLGSECKKILDDLTKGKVPLETCMEKTHMNTVGFKIATMIRGSSPAELAVLTMNGSPHCVQLHFAVEQAVQQTGSELKPRHFVVEKDEIREVTRETVWLARHLRDVDMLREFSKKTSMSHSGKAQKT